MTILDPEQEQHGLNNVYPLPIWAFLHAWLQKANVHVWHTHRMLGLCWGYLLLLLFSEGLDEERSVGRGCGSSASDEPAKG